MTDRINYLTVVLEKNIREDDVQNLIDTIKMIKYVLTVEANVVNATSYVEEQRIKHQLKQKLFKIIEEI